MTEWPLGVDRHILSETDSTMSEAARQAPNILRPTWIMADRQTAARGRRGRAWDMPEGNLAASLVLRPDEPPAQVALRSFVAALALHDAFIAATGRADGLSLKWPNDVLLSGGKVAGILLESLGQGDRVDHLIVGFGVNLAAAPGAGAVEPGAVCPVSLRGETGCDIGPEAFLTLLATAYLDYETQFTTFGFAPIRTAWLHRAARLNAEITARTTATATTGIFRDVDMDGNLVLETADGRRRIAAADIFF